MLWMTIPISLLLVFSACATPKSPGASSDQPLTEKPEAVASDEDVAAPVPVPCDWEPSTPWSTFQGSPGRTGSVAAPAIERPTLRWSKQVGIASWLNNPIIVEDWVFVGTSGQIWNEADGGDAVVALDLGTGETRWLHSVDGDVNGVVYDRCRIYATSDAGKVIAIDARSGDRLWVHEQKGAKFYTNPLAVRGLVVVGDDRGRLWALDGHSGEPRWNRSFKGAIRGGVAFDGSRIFVTSEDLQVAALDPKDGATVWSTVLADPNAKSIYAAPTVVNDLGLIVVGFVRDTSYHYPAVVALDAQDGSMKWTASNPKDLTGGWGNVRSSLALSGNRLIYGEPYSNRAVVIDAESGEVESSFAAGTCTFPHWPSPASVGEMFYLPRHDGGLYAIETMSGAVAWALYLGDATQPPLPFPDAGNNKLMTECYWDPPIGKAIYASPAIAADGTVIVATGDGFVHAVSDAEK